jgi:hypothetical protein
VSPKDNKRGRVKRQSIAPQPKGTARSESVDSLAFALAYTSGVIAPYVMDGIKGALSRLGYRVVHYTPDLLDRLYPRTAGDSTDRTAILGANLKRWAAKNGIIAVIGYGGNLLCKTDEHDHFIQPCILAGIPSVSLWYDRPFDTLYKYGRDAPLSWDTAFWQQTCFDRKYIDDLRADGFENVHYLPLATDDRLFRPLAGAELDAALAKHASDAVFVGSYTELRADALSRIRQASSLTRIAVYGNEGWRTNARTAALYRGAVAYGADLNAVYCASKVVINLDTPQLVTSLNNRVFDALAGGNLIITEDKPDAHLHFEPGRDLLVYASMDELARLVSAVTASPESYAGFAVCGREKVVEKHTWTARVRQLIKMVAPIFGWKVVEAH